MPARRGTFIVPAEVRWTIKGYFADLTSRSLRRTGSEGHACHARRSGMDNPIWGGGRDKQVPRKGGLWVNCAKAKRPTYNKTQTSS